MKKIMSLLLLMLSMSAGQLLFAQDEHEMHDSTLTAEERATKRTEKMKTELNLTEAQQQEIYTINLAHIVQMDQYRQEQKALREKIRAEREATRTKIKAVLTPEQNVIFDQKTEEMKAKRQQHHQHKDH